jgi:hypothetical protein
MIAGETASGGKLGDHHEVMVLPTRQAPAQQAFGISSLDLAPTASGAIFLLSGTSPIGAG